MDLKELIESETGNKFKNKKITCPFHKDDTPSLSVKKYPDKEIFTCFGCEKQGDNIYFIREYKGYSYVEACNYLGIELSQEQKEIYSNLEMIEKSAKNYAKKENLNFVRLHSFTGDNNKVLYYKVIFKNVEGKKQGRYYHIENNKVIFTRGSEEVPYNYYKLIKGLENNKYIFLAEGEKDADTLSNYGYIATSFKGVTKFDYSIFKDAIVYIIPDTGEAGEKYKDNLWNSLKNHVKEFNVIYPKAFRNKSDNYDITDWFEEGHTIDEFRLELKDKWDYKKSRLWPCVRGDKSYPLPVLRNVEQFLKRENIEVKYNLITKQNDIKGFTTKNSNYNYNNIISKVHSKSKERGLSINKNDFDDYLDVLAKENSYNPFIELLDKHKNNNYSLIDEFFDCLTINRDFIKYKSLYRILFRKWLRNLVIQSNSTEENPHKQQGALILQGGQGKYKSTFFKQLIRNNEWFNGEENLKLDEMGTSKRDEIKKHTHYVLTELAELKSSSNKKTKDDLKAFLTREFDEYRPSHAKYEIRVPRVTSFCGTVNDTEFLVDDTGNRRFLVIPIESIDINRVNKLNNFDMLGSVYNECLENYYIDNPDPYFYVFTKEELKLLKESNLRFTERTGFSMELEEKIQEVFDFNQPKFAHRVYRIKEIRNILSIDKKIDAKKALGTLGYKCFSQYDVYEEKNIEGFKFPNTDEKRVKELQAKKLQNENNHKNPINNKGISWNTVPKQQ